MSVGAVNKQTGDRIPTAGMPAIDAALSGSSMNPVQNRVVKAALDEKADTDIVASDFSSAASYTAGNYCIYEGKFYKFKASHSGAWSAADVDEIKIAGELASLKSGLTIYKEQNKVNINAPERHNILYASLTNIKSRHTAGTWSGDSYTHRGITYAFTAVNDIVTQVDVSGTATQDSEVILSPTGGFVVGQGFILSGCPVGGEDGKYSLYANYGGGIPFIYDKGEGAILNAGSVRVGIRVLSTADLTTPITYYPMVRPSWDDDTTFAPYIPSVESRLEIVESGYSNLSDYQKHNDTNLQVPTRTNLLNPAKMGGASADTVGVIDGDTITITTTNKAYGAYNSGSPSATIYKAGKYYVKCTVISNALGYGNITLRNSNSTIKANMRINTDGDYEGILEITEPCYFSILTTQSTAASNTVVIEDLIVSPFDVAYTPYVPSVEERLAALEAAVFNS